MLTIVRIHFPSFLSCLGILALSFTIGCGRGSLFGGSGSSASGGSGGSGGSSPTAPTSLVYTLESVTYVTDVLITDNVPTTNGTDLTYSIIAGSLPSGLALSPTTGVISGEPDTPVAAATVTIQATNSSGSITRDLSIGAANGWVVNSTGDASDFDPGDTFCNTLASGTNGTCTLRAAIEEANSTGGTRAILVPAGTISVTTVANAEGKILIGSGGLTSLTITGAGSGSTTISGGDGIPRVLRVENATNVTISAMTLTEGLDDTAGGFIQHNGTGTLSLQNSIITDNHTNGAGGNAGAIGGFNAGGTVNISGCTLSLNSSDYYGGAIGSYGTTIITDSTFTSNSVVDVGEGGAIWTNGALSITDSTFSSNAAQSGGAISMSLGGGGGLMTITGSTFTGNTASMAAAGAGGALWLAQDINANITETTFNGNSATGSGGAVYLQGGGGGGETFSFSRVTAYQNSGSFGGFLAVEDAPTVTLTNVTVSENDSTGQGGGITVDSATTASTVNVWQSTIANNESGGGGGGISINGLGANTISLVQSIIANNLNGGATQNCAIFAGIVGGNSYNISNDATCNLSGSDQASADTSALATTVADHGGAVRTLSVSSASSPMVDAIPSGSCFSAVDARNIARPQGAGCDIGAFELE